MQPIIQTTQAQLDAKIEAVRTYIEEYFYPDDQLKIQLGVSGGKDSTACYLLFHELGYEFHPIFADTGNEHPDTVKHALTLHERVPGGPPVEVAKASFSAEVFARRRENLARTWSQPHRIRAGKQRGEIMPPFPQDVIDAALEVLHPTGNQFLDMMLLHGMNPTRNSQFCTLELKLQPVQEQFIDPWIEAGFDILSASGVRADESFRRKDLPFHEKNYLYDDHEPDAFIYRPILDWTAQDCFAMHRRHGVEPNPLYLKGMSRVGCLPCIHAGQAELVEIHKRFPEQLDRIEAWERAAAKVNRWAQYNGRSEFISFIGPRNFGGKTREMLNSTKDYVEWIGENKQQYELEDEAPFCSSTYGLCE